MAEKFAIYFGEPLATATAGYEDQRSARVNQVAHEWLQMIADGVPQLSVAEWQALMATTSSTAIADDDTLRLLWAAIDDSAECDRFGVDGEDLARKIRTLTLTQRYALRETLARAWAAVEGGGQIADAIPGLERESRRKYSAYGGYIDFSFEAGDEPGEVVARAMDMAQRQNGFDPSSHSLTVALDGKDLYYYNGGGDIEHGQQGWYSMNDIGRAVPSNAALLIWDYFGAMVGSDAKGLVSWAGNQYGIDITESQAERWIKLYHADNVEAIADLLLASDWHNFEQAQ
jgi:hypothetical protein